MLQTILYPEKKQTLFFTANDQDAEWRLKEKIVAIIESYIQQGVGVSTISSIRVRDVVNDLEQLDVAFFRTSIQRSTTHLSRFVIGRTRLNGITSKS